MEFDTCIGTVKIMENGNIMFGAKYLGWVTQLPYSELQLRHHIKRTMRYEVFVDNHEKPVENLEQAANFAARMFRCGTIGLATAP